MVEVWNFSAVPGGLGCVLGPAGPVDDITAAADCPFKSAFLLWGGPTTAARRIIERKKKRRGPQTEVAKCATKAATFLLTVSSALPVNAGKFMNRASGPCGIMANKQASGSVKCAQQIYET